MTRAKPCANCRHPKSYHRKTECRYTWQAMGATFMGNRIITHWCLCGGYQERTSGGEQP